MIREVIARAHKHGCKLGLCGRASANFPDFVQVLVDAGIDSISCTLDSIFGTKKTWPPPRPLAPQQRPRFS